MVLGSPESSPKIPSLLCSRPLCSINHNSAVTVSVSLKTVPSGQQEPQGSVGSETYPTTVTIVLGMWT